MKGDKVAPFVNHALAIQGDKAQLMSCATTLYNWRLPSPLNMTTSLDRGPLTTPKSLPAYRASHASKTQLASEIAIASETAVHSRTNGASIASAVHWGLPEPQHTKQSWIGDHHHPEGAARCQPLVPLPPFKIAVPSKTRGPVTVNAVRSQPQARAVTAHFYPDFYPVFTPSHSVVFTLVLPRIAPPLLKCPTLPRFYPTFTPPPVFTLSSVLPQFYPVPSTLRTPIPPFLP